MKFNNPEKNISIEWTNPYSLKISLLTKDVKQLEGYHRILKSYMRGAPLEGGEPISFEIEKKEEEGIIQIKGDTSQAIVALCDVNFISEAQRDEMVTNLITDISKMAVERLKMPTSAFITKLSNNLQENASSPSRLKLFGLSH